MWGRGRRLMWPLTAPPRALPPPLPLPSRRPHTLRAPPLPTSLNTRAGKELALAARQEEDLRLKRLVEARELEKAEEARAREKIRAKLEEDRRQRRRKLGLPEELPEEEKEEERRRAAVGGLAGQGRAAWAACGRAGSGKASARPTRARPGRSALLPALPPALPPVQAKAEEEWKRKLPIKPVEGGRAGRGREQAAPDVMAALRCVVEAPLHRRCTACLLAYPVCHPCCRPVHPQWVRRCGRCWWA